jgi:hypothetical protein
MKCDRGEQQDMVLSATLQAAEMLGAPIARAFAYWREEDARATLADAGRALHAAASSDRPPLTLLRVDATWLRQSLKRGL